MDPFAEDTDLIRRLVAFTGLASAQVAKRAGISASTLNRPYKGTATTRLGRKVLEKLQGAFPEFPGWEAYFGTPFEGRASEAVLAAYSHEQLTWLNMIIGLDAKDREAVLQLLRTLAMTARPPTIHETTAEYLSEAEAAVRADEDAPVNFRDEGSKRRAARRAQAGSTASGSASRAAAGTPGAGE